MRAMIRWLFPPKPVISKEEAITIAQAECASLGWPWEEPLRVSLGRDRWLIRTGTNFVGGDVFMEIDCQNGQILEAGRHYR